MKKLYLPDKKCMNCESVFGQASCKRISDFKEKKFCSHKCYTQYNQGDNHALWKGGIRKRKDGYLRDRQDRYIHRLVVEKHIGRSLSSEEHVHHIDGDKANNAIYNLQVVSNSEHRKIESEYAKRDKKGRYA